MNSVDKISKEVLALLEYVKDTVKINLANSNFSGNFSPKLTDEQVSGISNLIDVSISQGYQNAITSFQKNISNVIKADCQEKKISYKILKKKPELTKRK